MAGRFLPPFTQTQSALFYFRDRRSIAFEAAGLLPPAESRGQREARGAGPQRQPRTGPS